MVDLVNSTGVIGLLVDSARSNVFGSIYITLFFILLVLIICAFIFRIPISYMAVLMTPLFLATAIADKNFAIFIGVAIFLIAMILVNRFFLND